MEVRLGLKLGQIGTKWNKCGTFKYYISVHFGTPNRKLSLKSPRFVPLGTNLTQFGCQIWQHGSSLIGGQIWQLWKEVLKTRKVKATHLLVLHVRKVRDAHVNFYFRFRRWRWRGAGRGRRSGRGLRSAFDHGRGGETWGRLEKVYHMSVTQVYGANMSRVSLSHKSMSRKCQSVT